MTTTSRVMWFFVAFSLFFSIGLAMFRGDDEISRSTWIGAGIFGVAMAVAGSVLYGKRKQ